MNKIRASHIFGILTLIPLIWSFGEYVRYRIISRRIRRVAVETQEHLDVIIPRAVEQMRKNATSFRNSEAVEEFDAIMNRVFPNYSPN